MTNGATAIAKALETNTTLSELNLDYNNIGDEGATAIAKALETNTTLSELNLGGNNIGDEWRNGNCKSIGNKYYIIGAESE